MRRDAVNRISATFWVAGRLLILKYLAKQLEGLDGV